MATILTSPGVAVSVTDESFYGSAGPGTVPLIVFATAANKASPTGAGIAPGTVPSQANKLFLATSQRELIQTFGNPNFKVVQGTPVHGHELNEYGLHAAYQYLGLSNRAYVMRADVDLAQLEASVSAPRGEPVGGTIWLDLNESEFGVFQSNGDTAVRDPFSKQSLVVAYLESHIDSNTGFPVTSLGEDGDFAIATIEAHNRVFEKIDGVWYHVGTTSWKRERSFVRSATPAATLVVGNSFSINGITIVINSTGVAQAVVDINAAIAAAPSLTGKVFASADSAGRFKLNFTEDVTLANVTGTPLTALGIAISGASQTFKAVKLSYAAHNKIPQLSTDGDVWIKTTPVNGGAKYAVKRYDATAGAFADVTANLYESDVAAAAALGASAVSGTVYVQFNAEGTSGAPLASHVLRIKSGSAWSDLKYEEDYEVPTTAPEEGTLWYNTDFQADIMVSDGDQWLGYRNFAGNENTDPNGVILSSTAPLEQSDGTPIENNDLWLDTSDLENYPRLYRFNATSRRWVAIDNTDQTTPEGIVFADARWDSGPTYDGAPIGYTVNSRETADLVKSNFVDPDCVDPRVYTTGTLLFNTRFSTYNVKEWKPNYLALGGFDANTDFTEDEYEVGGGFYTDGSDTLPIRFPALADAGRWVTASGNQVNGAPFMGRKAQRQMIVKALSATVAGNEDLRSELVYFNLIAAPGYPELIDEMITLNTDQKEVAFIVGDTPARLKASATDIQNWATNANNAPSNGDLGLTSRNINVGLYYPWGLSTNVDGTEIMVPPSTMALRTMAYNDQVAYPWFAPAGFTRGLVTNAASVGYLTEEGEYQPVILNQGQRDVMYLNKINPIAYIPNRGLVVYGQKTTSPVDSALDRVNVARLANYMRYNLDNLAKPFLFEQNDNQTRDAFRITIERFLMGLVGLRALEDFAVVCDTTNNTPERRDRNELWADIFIQPLKSVEFIYLPIRIRNSGDSLDL